MTDSVLRLARQALLRTGTSRGLPLLSLLGLLTGIVGGLLIVSFHWLVNGLQRIALPGGILENFEQLTPAGRFWLPVCGSLLLILMLLIANRGYYTVGLPKLMDRIANNRAILSLKGLLVQFFGAAIAIVSGHAIGREGPHIFLGGSSASLIGQALHLPYNAIRTLVGAGIAAGIAASFNTPLAGVVFALEVVLLEMNVQRLSVVMLAAISATAVTQQLLGNQPMFPAPRISPLPVDHLLPVLILGFIGGFLGTAFNRLVHQVRHISQTVDFRLRLLLAGALAGLIGVWVPESLGIGYDSVQRLLAQAPLASALWLLLIAKLLASTTAIGLGIPGGTIGPTLFVGAVAGSLFAGLAVEQHWISPEHVSLLVLLGMGSVMAAMLMAPFAALVAILELTLEAMVVMPGMIAIITSYLVARGLFGNESLFVGILKSQGRTYGNSPLNDTLKTISVLEHLPTEQAAPVDLPAARRSEVDGRASLFDLAQIFYRDDQIIQIRVLDRDQQPPATLGYWNREAFWSLIKRI